VASGHCTAYDPPLLAIICGAMRCHCLQRDCAEWKQLESRASKRDEVLGTLHVEHGKESTGRLLDGPLHK
jgi:hypothetical protein